ncbi:type II toxin-antitoxin system HicA family toxin [Leptolyngbya sp. AN03gr2]|uniref:type II toxin-antitoxin system HicA family toxin n=1 Tax=unclassified Leptolyngbya TaxID=2650499 RepID=UPI003D31DBBA
MKLPRDLSGLELAKRLKRFEYVIDRQTGSHIRLTTEQNGEHHITIPAHNPLKVGTLSAILGDVAEHLELSRDELIAELFQK